MTRPYSYNEDKAGSSYIQRSVCNSTSTLITDGYAWGFYQVCFVYDFQNPHNFQNKR